VLGVGNFPLDSDKKFTYPEFAVSYLKAAPRFAALHVISPRIKLTDTPQWEERMRNISLQTTGLLLETSNNMQMVDWKTLMDAEKREAFTTRLFYGGPLQREVVALLRKASK
jgi:hypothetical protein